MTLPASWEQAQLAELGSWVGGGTPNKRVPGFWNGDIPWVSPKDMKVARIRDTQDHITQDALAHSATTLVAAGSVLVVVRSGILRHTLPVAVTDRGAALNQDMKALLPGAEVVPEYVAWGLRAFSQEILHSCSKSGTTVQSIDTERLLEYSIPLAPAAEQRRIVAAIEERFSRLDAAEDSLRRAQRVTSVLRSSLITASVAGDWSRRPWREVGLSQNGRAFPSRDYSKEGIKLLRPGNLHASGRVVWTSENTRRLPDRYEHEFPAYVVGPNELVMNLTAQSLRDEFLGRVCLTNPGDHCLLNQRIARLIPNEADTNYLLLVFKSRPFRRFVESLNKGSLIQHMFTSQLAEFEIPLPPLEDQRRIVAEVERQLSLVDALSTAIDAALRRSRALRRSILERAFTGKLVPQDPSDEPAPVLLKRIANDRVSSDKPARRRKTRA